MHEVMAACRSDSLLVRKAYLFASSYLENKGNFEFEIRPLPISAQFSPVFGLGVVDANADSSPDLLCVGNFWSPNVHFGRYDASSGEVLRGDGEGGFEAMSPRRSGLLATGDVRDLRKIEVAGRSVWLIARNDGKLLVYGKTVEWNDDKQGR